MDNLINQNAKLTQEIQLKDEVAQQLKRESIMAATTPVQKQIYIFNKQKHKAEQQNQQYRQELESIERQIGEKDKEIEKWQAKYNMTINTRIDAPNQVEVRGRGKGKAKKRGRSIGDRLLSLFKGKK